MKFINWIEKDKKIYFLTKHNLKSKKYTEWKKHNLPSYICEWRAIEFFYPKLEKTGKYNNYCNFSTPNGLPIEIISAIKAGDFEGIGIYKPILNGWGRKKYKLIEEPALKKYEKSVCYVEEQVETADYYQTFYKTAMSAHNKYIKICGKAFWEIAKQKKYRKKLWK